MTIQQQQEQYNKSQARTTTRRRPSRRTVIISTVMIIAISIAIIWILSSLKIISGTWATIISIIITVLGLVFAFLQSMHVFVPADHHEASEPLIQPGSNSHNPALLPPASPMPQIIVQLPATPPSSPSPSPDKPSHRGIVGLPPPSDPRTIQQRAHIVKEVYTKLIQPDITALALTGIGGVGKSTLAALLYSYAEEQRHTQTSPFLAETLWLTADPAVTFTDLAGNLFEALGKLLPDLSNLAPQNQAVALFNALNTTDKPRLIILDQFENLLNWDSGHALTDRPGVGEWLDIINSQRCACRILLTSRPRPIGTREYLPIYLQEYQVGGLEVHEGIALLREQGVQGTETELHTAVTHCAGHAFSLMLLASLVRDHHMSLATLFKNSALWTGDIATNLLDQIYTQRLNDAQRELLLAFSVYREPVSLEAAQAVMTGATKGQVPSALKALLVQHLLEPAGEGRYQLHAIIADYARGRFDESSEQANEEALRAAHTKAGQYYLQLMTEVCPPIGKRGRVSDVEPLIEAVRQLCQAERWQQAYDLMWDERLFADLKRWGESAVLLELYELLLPLDKWGPGRSQQARIYYSLGNVYRVIGKTERAREYLEWALSIYRELASRGEEGRVLSNLGRVYGDIGKIKQAGEYYKEALTISKEVGDTAAEGAALNDLAWVYYISGELEHARQYYEKALSIHQSRGHRWGESTVLNNLGRVYRVMGEKSKAKTYYEQALAINREQGDRAGEGWALHNLGKVYKDFGQNEQALEYLEQALSIRREIGDRRSEGRTLSAIGRVYLALGKMERAWEYYESDLRIAKEIGDSRGEASSLNNLGKVCIMRGQKMLAMEYFKQALSIRRKVEDRARENSTLYDIGRFYFEQRQYDIALGCFLLDKKFLAEVQHPYYEEVQSWIEKIRQALGDEQFTALLVTVEPQAQQIVEAALSEVDESAQNFID